MLGCKWKNITYTFKVYKKEDTKGSNKMKGHKVKTKLGRLLAGAKRAALYIGWSQARRRHRGAVIAQYTKLSITHSFFELQSPDFAWEFV